MNPTRIMHQYQRFMRRREENSNDTIDTFRSFLEKAPGVVSVSEIEPHRKGGFSAAFELEHDRLDAFLAELDINDWMSAM